MDYQKLCLELFGTDNVEELKRIAKKIGNRNPRNAGRKKKFQLEDVQNMRDLINGGMTINEVAERYGTSRQMISKYIHAAPKPTKGCMLRMTYMYRKVPCTIIDVDFLDQKVTIRNETENLLHRAFGVIEEPTWEDFEVFLQERCFPAARGNVKELLRDLQLTDYDPLQIVEKTQGRMADDDMWLRFTYYSREDMTYGAH